MPLIAPNGSMNVTVVTTEDTPIGVTAPDGSRYVTIANSDSSFVYEEDAWTPVLTFVTPGDLAVTYSTQLGSYVRIGNLVFVSVSLVTSAFTHTTASGLLNITGLPYSSKNVSGYNVSGGCQWRGITKASYTDVALQIGTNTDVLSLSISGSGQSATSVSASDTPTGGTIIIRGTIFYETA